jgi:hypothetical protein
MQGALSMVKDMAETVRSSFTEGAEAWAFDFPLFFVSTPAPTELISR